jgi:hypothetical protein
MPTEFDSYEIYVKPPELFVFQVRDDDHDVGLCLIEAPTAEAALAMYHARWVAAEAGNDEASGVYGGRRLSAHKTNRPVKEGG